MSGQKEKFVQELRRMVREKGVGVFYNAGMLKASLSDYATDALGLRNERVIFYNTVVTETMVGGNLGQAVRDFSTDFDLEKQKNWMRWLKECNVMEENAAFAIVCLEESLSSGAISEEYLNKKINALIINKTHQDNNTENAPQPEDDKKNYFYILVIGVLLLAIIAALVVYYNNHKMQPDSQAEVTTSTDVADAISSNENAAVASEEIPTSAEPVVETEELLEETKESEVIEESEEAGDSEIAEDPKAENNSESDASQEKTKKVNLSGIDPFNAKGITDFYAFRNSSPSGYATDNYYRDNFGNDYKPKDTIIGVGYMEFCLNKEYKYLDFTTYVTKQALNEYDFNNAGFAIYGDDEIIFEFSDFDTKMKPFDTTLDISNYDFIKIECKKTKNYGLSNFYVY